MSDSVENQVMTLAQLAGLDTSEILETRASRIGEGLYTFEVTKAEMEERMVKDNTELRYCPTITVKVIEVSAVTEPGFTAEDMLGKTYTENWFINPEDSEKAAQTIGYLKGFVADMGCENTGPMGGVEGAEPGFLDKTVTHLFRAKIVTRKGQDGEKRARIQFLKKAA